MNKDMRLFLVKLVAAFACMFSIMLAMLLFGAFIVRCQYEDSYMAALVDKVERLNAINEPKIMLVGDSNLAFGIDSGMMENALNMPVVNLGLHGGLGNAFHENIAKLNINSGDIVVVCHTNYSDDNTIKGVALCWVALEYHLDLWKILRPEDYLPMMAAYPRYWLDAFMLWKTPKEEETSPSAYLRNAFNKYGDVVIKPGSKKNMKEKFSKPDMLKVASVNDICVTRLNELNKYTQKRGASMLIAGYPIASGEYTPPAEEYDKFQNELAEKLECEIISNFRDYFIPYSCFYDTAYHLNEEGVLLRTTQLIKDIKKWQEGRKQ